MLVNNTMTDIFPKDFYKGALSEKVKQSFWTAILVGSASHKIRRKCVFLSRIAVFDEETIFSPYVMGSPRGKHGKSLEFSLQRLVMFVPW